ncbi:HAP3 [Candida theae]|uniref:HAP3 n=1 Tax=Candida theae TaxID=1198502 RepID=A0AAD5B9U7_9ASCO|nr:HAP3 [Candida theae]KAI5948937.1 HAP3 [Candida theae]
MEPNTRDLELREQDRWLPIANVARLMKNTLPPTAKVSKDAKECMQECVSEFISFITSEASDRCLREKRKTINGEDILYSMYDLGFENYAEVLKIYLAKYREQQVLRQERGETRLSKKKAKLQAAQQQAAQEAAATSEETSETRQNGEPGESGEIGETDEIAEGGVIEDAARVDELVENGY